MKHANQSDISLNLLIEFTSEADLIRPMKAVQVQKEINAMFKNIFILCSLLLLWFISDAVWADSKLDSEIENKPNTIESAYSSLWLQSSDGSEKYATEALTTSISMSVSGPILRAKVKQTFRNSSQTWLEGIYSFPLPEQAAVDQLRMVIGDRIVEGQIKEKHAAKANYDKARANGQRTSLLSLQRTNRFTTALANIGPQEDITVEFEYQQILDFRDHQYTLRFPMVTTPQYTPPNASHDQSLITPIDLTRSSSSKPGNPVSISLDLKPGFPAELPSSTSHPISVNRLSNEHYTVDLKGSAHLSNRDFIVSWKLKPSSTPMASILREDVNGESYGLMMVMPPQISPDEFQGTARELIWVLDVSGSMQGESIEQARSAILKALSKLQPEDYFNIICFNTQAWKLFPSSRSGSTDNLNLAREKILQLEANGGTEMRPALSMALNQSEQHDRLRQVIFVTDGAVSNEAELFSEIKSNLGASRLFTVGIGSAPNSYFMRKAALVGRGSFTYISQPQEVSRKVDKLLRRLEFPALTDLSLDLNDPTASVLPQVLPDVYLGEPVYIAFKAEHFPRYANLRGTLNGIPSDLRLPLQTSITHHGVAIEWARRKIASLEERYLKANPENKSLIRDEAIELALTHHQVSKFTSLLAVDTVPERAGGILESKNIPANAPKGWVGKTTSSKQGIHLAKTATNTPFHLFLGTTLLFCTLGLCLLRRRLIWRRL